MKVALYARISTDEQVIDNQTLILNKWAEDRGWEVGETYTDTGSAFQRTDQRELNRLLRDCDRGKYKLVLVFSLSRLTRKGPLELMQLLKQFADKGAPVHSYSEPVINVPDEIQPLFVALYGMMAKQFSTTLSKNVKAGMARAKVNGTKSGKPIGRPRKRLVNTAYPFVSKSSGNGQSVKDTLLEVRQ